MHSRPHRNRREPHAYLKALLAEIAI
jgi:hypothetical protein